MNQQRKLSINKSKFKLLVITASLLSSLGAITCFAAEDKIELEVTRIKANQELPQILYVVPWKDVSGSGESEQKLVLHDFFGDLYDPVLPSQIDKSSEPAPVAGK